MKQAARERDLHRHIRVNGKKRLLPPHDPDFSFDQSHSIRKRQYCSQNFYDLMFADQVGLQATPFHFPKKILSM